MKDMTFEKAYERLEQILAKMNGQAVSLDESLALYEEADKLLGFCTKKLDVAEKKIQILIKGQSGEIEVDADGNPITAALPDQDRILKSDN